MIEQTEKEILESELGFYLYEIGQATEESRSSVESLYDAKIQQILRKLSQEANNG